MATDDFAVRRIPQTAPRIISADEAWHGEAPYAQDALALDFHGAHDEDFGPRPTRSGLLPDPGPFVARLASHGDRAALVTPAGTVTYTELAPAHAELAAPQRRGEVLPFLGHEERLPAQHLVQLLAVRSW